MLKHLAIFLCYAGGAAALALTGQEWLPQGLPLSGRESAVGLGLAALIGGGLLHEVYARLGREAFLADKLLGLRLAQGEALEELNWTRRELAILREALEAAGGVSRSGKSVDEVISEVKVLQSLITRLAKSSKAPLHAEAGSPAGAAMGDPARRPAEAKKGQGLPPREDALHHEEGGRIAVMPANANSRAGVLPPVAEGLDEATVLEIARQALRDDRIDLVLQPIVLLPQRKRRYYECFSRLRTSDGYMILPEQYIGLAEREGIVAAIDNMLLIRCIQLVRKMQYRSEKLDFFCNISSHTLGDDAFFGDFVAFLESNRDLSKHLIFEFSQNDYEAWDSGAALYLRRLADLGCRFSLDGVHHLNIDAEVLANRNFRFVKLRADLLLSQPQAGAALAERLKERGLRMVVEKVEDEDALIEVMELGIDCAQGYLLGEPRLARPAA
jgi:cyclic-di-GMP phosphodiesterase TipF (flagellum assembly factor)